MRPTSRRVTAQRKFAVGAYVPPTTSAAAVPGPSSAPPQPPLAAAAHERRDPALQAEPHHSSVVNGTISTILDTLCFQNSHNHVQPIVLVEKLDTTTDNNSVASSVRLIQKRQVKKRIKRKRRVAPGIGKNRVHMMNLRSVAQRRSLVRFSPQPIRAARLAISGQKSRDKIVEQPKRKSKRRGEFSRDDNMPLTYFAKCSTPIAPNSNAKPDVPDAQDTIESLKMSSPLGSVSDMCESMPPPQSRVVNRPKRPESTSTNTSSIIPLVHLIPQRLECADIDLQLEQMFHELRARANGKGKLKIKDRDKAKDKDKISRKSKAIDKNKFKGGKGKAKGQAKVVPKLNAESDIEPTVREESRITTHQSDRSSVPDQSAMDCSPIIPEHTVVRTRLKKRVQRRKSIVNKASRTIVTESHTDKRQESKNPSPVSYYSEQRIHSWMAENEPGPSRQTTFVVASTDVPQSPSAPKPAGKSVAVHAGKSAATPAVTSRPKPVGKSARTSVCTTATSAAPTPSASVPNLPPPTMEDDDEDGDFVLRWDNTDDCPANAWITLQDVADADKADFDRRCNDCKTCERVAKLLKITSLLKQQMRIDCLNDDKKKEDESFRESVCPGQSRSHDKTRTRPDGSRPLFLELIPSNKHLMMCVEKRIHSKQVYSAYFTIRSDINDSPTLILSENDELLDHLTETLSLNLSEGPSNLVKNLRSPRASPPTFSSVAPAESCIDMDDIMSTFSGTGTANSNPGPSTSRRKEKVKIPNAPVFYPTKEEFADPITYIKKIWDEVAKYGICKIVPPDGFVPPCKADDETRFEVSNQYISRLYCRWGAAAREFCAIKMCLKAQNINMSRPPLLDGVEVNLPKLYHLVQRHGGLETVSNKKKWGKVAEDMNLVKNPFTERKLDQIYVKYLLPYATLSEDERMEYLRKVELAWSKKHRKLLERASKPLHRKRRLLCETDSSSEETGDDETDDTEECVKPGCTMNLAKFKKVARSTFNNFFRGKNVTTRQVEVEYWRKMMIGSEHVCVNSASIDTGEQGLGFSKNKTDSYSKHPWNLKVLSENPSNVLRSMGPVLGVTVPTLHLGMLFTTSCWHRDPHAIAWVEYEHSGPPKIWYGIPPSKDKNFRRAMECLTPTSCQNKLLWLSSDISMIPPYLLLERNVEMYRVEQNPGEFVLVMPNAYTCSINTGFTVSESTYFATESWLDSVGSVFQEIRDSCEPTMFSLEKLLKDLVEDPRTTTSQLEKIRPAVIKIFEEELENRTILRSRGIRIVSKADEEASTSKGKKPKIPTPTTSPVWNVRDHDECEVCRWTLYLSKVKNIPSCNSMVCLEHAIKLLEKGNCQLPLSEMELHCQFSDQELLETIDTLRRRLDE